MDAGVLELDLVAELEGSRYFLEGAFAVSGAESRVLTTAPRDQTIGVELLVGSYALELQPEYRVLRDDAVVLTVIETELLSDRLQPFQITNNATTRVSFRFAADGGILDFGTETR